MRDIRVIIGTVDKFCKIYQIVALEKTKKITHD